MMKRPDFIDLRPSNRFLLFVLILLLANCTESKYNKLVKNEMASGLIHDSLLFGMKFGQTKQQFYDTCWQLNKEELVTHGPNNKFVAYKLPQKDKNNLKNAITMYFYGVFNKENIMTGMDLQFSYDAWSLWNKNLQSEQLVYSVKDSLKKWYPGNDFINVRIPKDSSDIFIKVDGNRRIIIKPIDDPRLVKARIDDLRFILEN